MGNQQFAIQNGHINSWFSQETWWFSIVLLVYQRLGLVLWRARFSGLFLFAGFSPQTWWFHGTSSRSSVRFQGNDRFRNGDVMEFNQEHLWCFKDLTTETVIWEDEHGGTIDGSQVRPMLPEKGGLRWVETKRTNTWGWWQLTFPALTTLW